jgi:hypothetical protein
VLNEENYAHGAPPEVLVKIVANVTGSVLLTSLFVGYGDPAIASPVPIFAIFARRISESGGFGMECDVDEQQVGRDERGSKFHRKENR